MKTSKNTSSDALLSAWVRERIDVLRPRLLDLTRKNPLLSTRLTAKTTSYVRVIDELPDVLTFALANQGRMRFAPLPSLDNDPLDEITALFRSAFSKAQRTDDEYVGLTSDLDLEDPASEEHLRRFDRLLKDRVRSALGMPIRQAKGDISLAKHAELHGISPSYDLPQLSEEHEDGRHRDDIIQTLLLRDQLERKLNGLITKCNTWIQETGINVFHAAYGFMEWKDETMGQAAFAPLILSPLTLAKKKSLHGAEYWVSGGEEPPQSNLVLLEMLKRQFNVAMPIYQGGSIEDYFAEIAALKIKTLNCTLRRQVAFGVFPSARMAMYHDLDPKNSAHQNAPIIQQLLGGADPGALLPFADENDVEKPELEAKVPCLVTDADSSQISVLVDLAEGRSLAVEGPPGTGKSQTIVNAIAAAIASGKRVLFVAEKTAALEVVKSRLEALRLGEFVMALQAERSTRERVIGSVRDRLQMDHTRAPRDFDAKLSEFRRLRNHLNEYVEVIGSNFGDTGLTVFESIGKAVATQQLLAGRTDIFVTADIPSPDRISRLHFNEIIDAVKVVDDLMDEARALPAVWQGCNPRRVDKLELDQIRRLSSDAADACRQAAQIRAGLATSKLAETLALTQVRELVHALDVVTELGDGYSSNLFASLGNCRDRTAIETFCNECECFQAARKELSKIIANCNAPEALQEIEEIHSLATSSSWTTFDTHALRHHLAQHHEYLAKLERSWRLIAPLRDEINDIDGMTLEALQIAHNIVAQTGPSVLSLRSPVLGAPEAAAILQRAATETALLAAGKARIEKKARIPSDITASQLHSCATTIEQATVLSFISSDYRHARRTLQGISIGGAPKGRDGAVLLREIASWKEAHQRFMDEPATRHCLGYYFAGLDTDFSIFRSLMKFYGIVESTLRGPTNRSMRTLLREAQVDMLFAIPALELTTWAGTVADLGIHIGEQRARCAALEANIARLEKLAPRINQLSQLAIDDVAAIIQCLRDAGLRQAYANDDAIARDVLGEHFAGALTQTDLIRKHLTILRATANQPTLMEPLRRALSTANWPQLHHMAKQVIQADGAAQHLLEALRERSGKDFSPQTADAQYDYAASLLATAAQDEAGLSAHTRIAQTYRRLRERGFGWVPRSPNFDAAGAPERFAPLVQAAIYRSMSALVMERHGDALNRFHGAELNQMRQKLADLDRDLLRLSREKLRAVAANVAIPHGNDRGPKSTWTDRALLENEIAKQKRFVPVRDLMQRARGALQALKPCWMMSPLAVAQYLPPEGDLFDLCIIDEASQMRPEDALGALARCKQAMIVGDVNQLPPSNFFQKMVADDEEEEDATVDEESILEIANAKLRPNRRLRWHYRSQHSNLIRFSNEVIYDSSLVIFPSPDEERADMGVSLVSVDGKYHNSVNPLEAKAIIDATLQFMKERPNESLGIVTLNQKQRDLIIEEMNLALERDDRAQRYVDDWKAKNEGLEEFFIKNLENVQGDERDVIFIGTVYGPDPSGGRPAQRFGPINGAAGRRRLNVLFSRAKKQIITFSSLKPSDITATEETNAGTYMLKSWLEYSATNILSDTSPISADPDSEFEVFVMRQIRAMGCEPIPQVGCAGYRIDIGVKHPDWPYGFLLAVECDGATYHSSRVARDRDRLRQEVLERLGWRFHRIWSTDWFNDPHGEGERLRQVISARLREMKASGIRHREPTPATSRSQANSSTKTTPVELVPPAIPKAKDNQRRSNAKQNSSIDVGDTVRVKFLAGSKSELQFTITEGSTNVDSGKIAAHEPLARELLGAEVGDVVNLLVRSYVREAKVLEVLKASARQQAS